MIAKRILASLLLLSLSSCGGGGGSGSGGGSGDRIGGLDSANFNCDGSCANLRLTEEDVVRIIQQAAAGAEMLGVAGTFAVVDRVGNVLSVYQMPGAPATTTISGPIGAQGGLEGVAVPASLAAISKAGTGAYLSSQGNAFSTRTASQIIQENFDPGEGRQGSGPLFGVQFSSLICSDVTTLDPALTGGLPSGGKTLYSGLTGPRPMPLGLSADSGGIPLYKNGDVVGGLGVEFNGLYTFDRNIQDFDDDPEERVALHGSRGFEAPSDRVGDVIFVGGKAFRYTDLGYDDLEPLPDPLPAFDPANLLSLALFTNGQVKAGAVFGTVESGVAFSPRAGVLAMTLVDPSGVHRFPSRNGSSLPDGAQLNASEVEALLDSALLTTNRARAAIRRPLDTPARVSIWIIDHLGVPLGFTRSADAPVFGIDVSLQKARAAAFFSSADAGDRLLQARQTNAVGAFEDYVTPAQALLGPNAFNGTYAYSNRAVGNIARPYFPDGVNGNPPGPLSLPFPGTSPGRTWSPFNVGVQLDLIFQRLVAPLGVPAPLTSLLNSCTDPAVFGRRIANGIQIFPGSVPLYRGMTLIGAIGVSGDGIDQDDMNAFYGASRQGLDFAGHTGIGHPELGFNAPHDIRSDRIPVDSNNVRLRYVNCPEGPFSGSNDQNVCKGL